MPWPLPRKDDERLALAREYPYSAPGCGYLLTGQDFRPLESGDREDIFAGRIPVIAHGSNRAPSQLTRKFAAQLAQASGAEAALPVTLGWLHGHDVVYAAHLTRYGAIASTLRAIDTCRVRIAINWLTPRQLQRMHETEGPGFAFGRLNGAIVTPIDGPSPERLHLYHGSNGCLAYGHAPVALAAVAAVGRQLHAMTQPALLEWLHRRHRPEQLCESAILAVIASTRRRNLLNSLLRSQALDNRLPGFEPVE